MNLNSLNALNNLSVQNNQILNFDSNTINTNQILNFESNDANADSITPMRNYSFNQQAPSFNNNFQIEENNSYFELRNSLTNSLLDLNRETKIYLEILEMITQNKDKNSFNNFIEKNLNQKNGRGNSPTVMDLLLNVKEKFNGKTGEEEGKGNGEIEKRENEERFRAEKFENFGNFEKEEIKENKNNFEVKLSKKFFFGFS